MIRSADERSAPPPLVEQARSLRAVAKRWSVASILTGITIAVILRKQIEGLVFVPGRNGIASLLWPLAGAIPAMVIAGAAGALHDRPEQVAKRSPICQRAGFVFLVMTLFAFGALISGPPGWLALRLRLRNDLGLAGFALGSAVLLDRSVAWIPTAAVTVIMWFFGPDFGGRIKGWAVLLQPTGLSGPDGITAAIAVAGAMLFIGDAPRALHERRRR